MNPNESEFPEPDILSELAEEMPPKVPLRRYRGAMLTLREKGYSYQDIADWLSSRLGVPVKRNQVSYVVTTDPAVQEIDDEQEELEDRADELGAGNS